MQIREDMLERPWKKPPKKVNVFLFFWSIKKVKLKVMKLAFNVKGPNLIRTEVPHEPGISPSSGLDWWTILDRTAF